MGEIQLTGLYGVSLEVGLYVFTSFVFFLEKDQPGNLLVKHEALYMEFVWKEKSVVRISGYLKNQDFSQCLTVQQLYSTT